MNITNCGKEASFLLNEAFFYAIITCQGFTSLDVIFRISGGGLNDKLGFDCFDSYNHHIFDF